MPGRSALISGATTLTSAPASTHALALTRAGASAPTTTQRRPSSRRKIGWVRIRPGIVPDAQSRRNARARDPAARRGAVGATSAGPRAPAAGGGALRPTRRAWPRTQERRRHPAAQPRLGTRARLRRALGADLEVLPGTVPGLLAGAVARGAHLVLLHGVRGRRAPAHPVGEHRRTNPPLRRRGHAHRARRRAARHALLGRELREAVLEAAARGLREAQPIAGGDRPAAGHHERREGRVQAGQLAATDARKPGRRLDAERALEAPLAHARRRLPVPVAEVRPVVALHLERGQELDVEVPGREAEGLAVVVAH